MSSIKKIGNIKVNYETIVEIFLFLYLVFTISRLEQAVFFEIILYGVLSLYWLTKRKKTTYFSLWIFILVIISAITILWSANPNQSIIETRILFQWMILSTLLIAYLDSEKKIINLYKYIVIGGIALVIRLITVFPLTTWVSGRLGSTELNLNSNVIGLYLTIASLMAFYLARYCYERKYYIPYIMFSVTVFFTGSRKALLLLLLGFGGILFLSETGITKKVKNGILIAITTLVLYLLIIEIPLLYGIIGYRIENIMNNILGFGVGDGSINERQNMIQIGLELFRQKAWFGHSLGSYAIKSGFFTYSHNNFIEILVGLGLTGFTIYYSMYVKIIVSFLSFKRTHIFVPIMTTIILLPIMEYGLVSYNDSFYQFIITVSFVGILMIRGRENEKNIKRD